MCDTLPPAPLSVRVRLSGLALAFALKRITIVIINASASAVPQGLSGVTESDGGGNTWVNLDCEIQIFICLMKGSVI